MNLRSRLAINVVSATGMVSRRLRLGGGSMIGGRLGLIVDPNLLASLGAHRDIALITGTNGKTTTTRLLTECLGGPSAVATSLAGANMPGGLVTALTTSRSARIASLEIDENYLPLVGKSLTPRAVVLLNLSRDQLDRVSEVRMLANKWRTYFTSSNAAVIANADDPLVAWAAGPAKNVVWVGAGNRWRQDAFHCPSCDRHITYAEDDDEGVLGWSCECGFTRPERFAWLDENIIVSADGNRHPINLALPGRFNHANATMAAVAALSFGVPLATSVANMARVSNVAGRFAEVQYGNTSIRLLLAKNPAGWTELIELASVDAHPVIIAINARDADGNDPSWLWDVPFEGLQGREVVATGERRHDLAVRLRHAGVAHRCVDDALAVTDDYAGQRIDFIGNYTAFQDFRKRVGSRAVAPAVIAALQPPQVVVAPITASVETASATAPVAAFSGQRSREADLVVVVVHPDLLGTYGDGGNGRVLANRALWRGISVELIDAPSDRALPTFGDIYCLGGGEDGPQLRSAERLRDGVLAHAVGKGATVLAICAGYQIIGTSFAASTGGQVDGVGLIDVTTVRGEGRRAVGEITATAHDDRLSRSGRTLTGFENHAGHTHRGKGVEPFARLLSGRGNGVDATDGAISGNVIGSYFHGPLLARNPEVADLLIQLATGQSLTPIDDVEEADLRLERLGRLLPRA